MSEKQGAKNAKPFMEVAYGYLPLVWGITLAHYLLPFLGEAGNILPVRLLAKQSPNKVPGGELHAIVLVECTMVHARDWTEGTSASKYV